MIEACVVATPSAPPRPPLMAALPEGELMARAARGLAAVAAARLGSAAASAVVGARRRRQQRRRRPVRRRPPRRGAASRAVCGAPRTHGARGGRSRPPRRPGSGRAADDRTPRPALVARPTSCSTASSASAAGPGCRRGRPHGSPRSPTTTHGRRRRPAERADPARRVDPATPCSPTRRSPSASPSRCTCCPAEPAVGLADRRRHRARASTTSPAVERLDVRRRRRALAGARPRRRQVLPRRPRRRGRQRGLHRRGRALVTAAAEAGAGMVRYVGTPTPTGAGAAGRARGGARRRPGAGLGGRAGARRRGAERAAPTPSSTRARGARRAEPVVVDAGGLDLLDAEGLDGGRCRHPAHPARRRAAPGC